ncbi:MAG: hypothetical protein EPO21_23235 [Chloroflexota bacterium]|nr:MAG: hypothetical protein EPO21_23235 [Chloroflexota bacterium]
MESLTERRYRLRITERRKASWPGAVLRAGLVLLIVLVFGSIAWALVPAVGAPLPAPGGAYVEGVVGNPLSVNPLFADFNDVDGDLVTLIFSGLTRHNDTGALVPDLAESWTISEDARTYTFRLRSGVTFHDGQPLTAKDVAFTVRAIQDTNFQGNPALAQMWRKVQVDQLDDYLIRFTLKEPFAPFLSYTTIGILPAHILRGVQAKDLRSNDFRNHPIGSGPYRVKELTVQHLLLESYPEFYAAQLPYIPSVELRFYPSYDAAMSALKQGEVLGLGSIKPGDVASLQQDSKSLRVYRGLRTNQVEVILNLRSSILADRGVRRALALGLDREKLVKTVVSGEALPADSALVPGSWLSQRDAHDYTYDPSAARKMLDESGWRENGQGIRMKDGAPLRLALLTNNDADTRVKAAEEVARQWRQIGVEVEVSSSGFAGLLKDYLIPRRFDAVVYGLDMGLDADVYSLWHSSQIGTSGFNFSSFANQQADQILDEARRTSDAQGRMNLYARFGRIFAEETPSIPLYHPTYGYAVSTTVHGVRLGLMEDTDDRFQYLTRWFMKTKRQLRLPFGTFDF